MLPVAIIVPLKRGVGVGGVRGKCVRQLVSWSVIRLDDGNKMVDKCADVECQANGELVKE